MYVVAAGENVLPQSDATMSFWSGGHLYIARSVFTGIAREVLDIGRSRNDKEKLVVLYSGSRAWPGRKRLKLYRKFNTRKNTGV